MAALIYVISLPLDCCRVKCVKERARSIHLWKKRARYAKVKNRYVPNAVDAAMFVLLNLPNAKIAKEPV
jgi:hypothetical protein